MIVDILSIRECVDHNSSISQISCNVSGGEWGVRLDVRTFKFEENSNKFGPFTLEHLRDVYYDYLSSPHRKYGDYVCEIAGTIEEVSYEKSQEVINFYMYYGGRIGNISVQEFNRSASLHTIAEDCVKKYWAEISKLCSLPPTRIYQYKGAGNKDCFGIGDLWDFCFIFLNDKSKEGIVLSGFCSVS